MTFEPETWTAEQYLGRAEAGRTKPLRLNCSRKTGEPETGGDRAEFYAKFVGLSEVTEQMLFAEMLGNALARAGGIATGEPAFIEIDDSFGTFLRRMDIRVRQGLGVGSRNLGPGLSAPTFGRMSPEQLGRCTTLFVRLIRSKSGSASRLLELPGSRTTAVRHRLRRLLQLSLPDRGDVGAFFGRSHGTESQRIMSFIRS